MNPATTPSPEASSGGNWLASSLKKAKITTQMTPAEKLMNDLFKKIDPLLSSSLPEEISHLIAEYAAPAAFLEIRLVSRKCIFVEFLPIDTLAELKIKISEAGGPPPREQCRLLRRLSDLRPEQPLGDILKPNDVVYLLGPQRG